MAPAPLPDACFLTAAYFRDGTWYCEHVPCAMVGVLSVCPAEQLAVRYPARPDSEDEEEGETSLYFPARSSHDVFRALCTSVLGDVNTLRLQKDLVVSLRKIPSLSSCRVDDDERFGQLSHWSRLMEHTGAPNLVLFVTDLNQFYVVSAKRELPQHGRARSALCWLRERAGLGFSYDACGGVFRIQVFRQRCKFDGNRWEEALPHSSTLFRSCFPHPRSTRTETCLRPPF